MKIILLRHGKPEIPHVSKIRASEIQYWVDVYNSAGLCSKHPPPVEALEISRLANKVVCSDLRRSVESAKRLSISDVSLIDKEFRELAFPYSSFRSPPLSPYIWLALFRALWFFGYAKNGESFQAARFRAARAAETLIGFAREHGSVLLVGHWFLNLYIAKSLRASGWRGPAVPSKKHWAFGVYEYAT